MFRPAIGGPDAIAIAAQVRRDDMVFFRKRRGDLVPTGKRQRIAVQQEQRLPAATMAHEYVRAIRAHPLGLEAREQTRVGRHGPARGSLRHRALRAKSTRNGGDEMPAIYMSAL